MATFTFSGQQFDSSRPSEVGSYLDQHKDQLAQFTGFLVGKPNGVSAPELEALHELARSRMEEDPSGDYGSIAQAANSLGSDQIPRLDTVLKTIDEAEAIDANAKYIAACGADGPTAVVRVAGSKPSSGFVNEPASAVRAKAQAILGVWALADDPNKKLMFFTDGFGTDPCLAARLTGIQDFGAQLAGIGGGDTKSKNVDLRSEITTLYGEYTGEETESAFRTWLADNHGDIEGHDDFESVWSEIKTAFFS
jgi:hypothetical protein